MKFFRERPLKVQVALLLSFLAILFIVELFVIRQSVSSLEKLHYQRDLAREAQLTGQEIISKTKSLLQGEQQLATSVLADVEQLDHIISILSDGGRIDGTAVFVDPLHRLPAISLQEVEEHWQVLKQNVHRATQQTTHQELKVMDARWISLSSWYDKLIRDMDTVVAGARTNFNVLIFILAILNLVLLVLLYYFFRRNVIAPLKVIEQNTSKHQHTLGLPKNEIADVARQVNEITEQLKDALQFIQEIGKGNLGINYRELDARYEPGKNKLADSLIEMQNKLRDVNAEEQRRQWANDGLAKFIDILRTGGEDIRNLGDKIIATLVGYTRSNQGGLYLLNDDDQNNKYLELISLFAFDTKKFESQRIKLGEGILGQTFLEKETTYITDVPHEYIRITSGLGDANPKSLLVVPLKIDTVVYGVVELASLTDFKDHEIKFVERLSETIASAFANVKSVQRNRTLLEESNTAAEMMRSQEEEMRQNMEELQATQEEMARKEKDYLTKIEQLEKRVKQGGSSAAYEQSKEELVRLQSELENLRKELADERRKLASIESDWTLAEDVERALKINLEALKITRQEMGGTDS